MHNKSLQNWQKHKIIQSKQHQLLAYQTINELIVTERNKKQITLQDGTKLIEFLSCSYLGLDQDERLIQASSNRLHNAGINFAVSRTRLRMVDFAELELHLNEVFSHGFSTTFSSLHVAHMGILPLLSTGEFPSFPVKAKGATYILDKSAHNSLQICRGTLEQLGDVSIVHMNDQTELEAILQNVYRDQKTPVMICDGVGSMGGLSPIKETLTLLEQYEGYLYCDDAHGVSVFGQNGCGFVLDATGVFHPRLILAVSLSKGFGTNGAAILVPTEEDDQFIKRFCSTYIFGNPMPLSLVSASIASCKIHLSEEIVHLQNTLRKKTALFDLKIQNKEKIINYFSPSPIRGIFVGDEYQDIKFTTALREKGFAVSAAMYPTVAQGKSIIRISLSVNHEDKDILQLCQEINSLV